MATTYLDTLRELIPFFKQYAIFYVSDINPKGEIVLAFDAIQETNFKAETAMTSYPTENNQERTDGKYKQPSVLTVRGIIQKNSVTGSAGSAFGLNLFQKTKNELEKFLNVICRLDIQTKNGFYKNYSLISYEIPENLDNYSYFEVLMTFKENLIPAADQMIVKNISDLNTMVSGWLSKVGL